MRGFPLLLAHHHCTLLAWLHLPQGLVLGPSGATLKGIQRRTGAAAAAARGTCRAMAGCVLRAACRPPTC